MKSPPYNNVEEVVDAIASGGMVIVVDDEARENEGDLICAADTITPEQVNFMATHGKGLICIAMETERLEQLGLKKMAVEGNQTPYCTAFMESVDASSDITTGISAQDRAITLTRLAKPSIGSEGFIKPGHLFPLQADPQGVLARPGHTEAAVDLAKAAGRFPAGVICEILNPDGSMARLPDLLPYAEQHQLPICRVADIIAWRKETQAVPPA